MAQTVKNTPEMWETWVRSLGWEDSWAEGLTNLSSILAWRIPMDRGAWWATVHGVTKSQTQLSDQAQRVVIGGKIARKVSTMYQYALLDGKGE